LLKAIEASRFRCQLPGCQSAEAPLKLITPACCQLRQLAGFQLATRRQQMLLIAIADVG